MVFSEDFIIIFFRKLVSFFLVLDLFCVSCHLGSQVYCDYCTKPFTSKKTLTVHIGRVHMGKRHCSDIAEKSMNKILNHMKL